MATLEELRANGWRFYSSEKLVCVNRSNDPWNFIALEVCKLPDNSPVTQNELATITARLLHAPDPRITAAIELCRNAWPDEAVKEFAGEVLRVLEGREHGN